jgi:hypothetical protein
MRISAILLRIVLCLSLAWAGAANAFSGLQCQHHGLHTGATAWVTESATQATTALAPMHDMHAMHHQHMMMHQAATPSPQKLALAKAPLHDCAGTAHCSCAAHCTSGSSVTTTAIGAFTPIRVEMASSRVMTLDPAFSPTRLPNDVFRPPNTALS